MSARTRAQVKLEAVEPPSPSPPPPPSPRKRRKGTGGVKLESVAIGCLDSEAPVTPVGGKSRVRKTESSETMADTTPSGKKTPGTKRVMMPGQTPFPSWPAPTAAQCADVVARLESWHGVKEAPKVIPIPSLDSSGCGQVPSILDALIRTLLSAATNRRNSSAAFRNIVQTYGVLGKGVVGEGSVDWDAVRREDEGKLFEAIKCGGLAKNKSRNIKRILDMVYEENTAAALNNGPPQAAIPTDSDAAQHTTPPHVLSLDHLHSAPTDVAMSSLLRFPGIGVKTASCTLLFCLSRPSFAVDTHVHRLCSWLGWIPPRATRDQAFFHLDTRIPDDRKYALHVLMWQHGVACPRCRLIPVKERREFDGMECPLGELIEAQGGWKATSATAATGGKGRAVSIKAPGKGKGKRKRLEVETEDEASESGSSDLSDID
ncbi:hypothetical protein QFC19_002643 [Naganishia cerealis]|uniref:Uncharacterized protein n=1 Tax=Naganishia cerealis TaxID=610337 RepID=A0ACC2W9B0_9TREE|nr:hypothetical protein QFC19_002643 [Naganishia cerealis]